MPKSTTIQKHQSVPVSSNYPLLREKGIQYIIKLGSRLWTDYNIHDPGITLLEALCYALTDLGYRTSFDIKDLLALPSPESPEEDGQFPADKRQAFYTARQILTINPWTTDDFRKLLINIDGVKNAWLRCKQCPCDGIYLYANCSKSILQYEPNDHSVIVKGLYDVWLEFEDEEKSGNLNSGKIKYNFSFKNSLSIANATIEMRLPSWAKLEANKPEYVSFRNPQSEIKGVEVLFISGNKTDGSDIPDSPESVLDNALRRPVFADIRVKFNSFENGLEEEKEIVFKTVPIRVWFRSTEERQALTLNDLKAAIEDDTESGIIPKYLDKIKQADIIVADAKKELHSHRNLAEDYCSIGAVEVEDIAVCMDMEVDASADIEAILGEAYYLIDQYFSPDLKFYSLQQLLDEKMPVDEIFEGPALSNGFIKNDELAAANLPTMLYASDVINFLMDIPGVKSVKNFVFARYDEDGYLVESEPWSMEVKENHQPRLYIEASKTLVFKNGLPFLPDSNELIDTLQMVKGRHTQPKFSVLENDLPVPHGTYYDLESYFPVQDSLPLTYGTGYEGLPESAVDLRKAQARQLKAYLLFFEQLLVNYLAQLSHFRELFAVDESVEQTYFTRFIETPEISGLSELYDGLNATVLSELTETKDIFLDRRNRFLDHLLARFAESFNDYALMLYSYSNDKAIADKELIGNKISFLRHFPELSKNRAKSIHIKSPSQVCDNENLAGLAKRIQLLLGYGSPHEGNIELYDEKDTDGISNELRWRLVDKDRNIYLSSSTRYVDSTYEKAKAKAQKEIDTVFSFITQPSAYKIRKVKKYVLNLVDETGEVIATRKQHFKTPEDAETARDKIIAFAKQINNGEQIFIVEHVLLRPRTTSDPLLSVCLPADCCQCCCEDDPYSFRITVVLNGEDGLANKGIAYRRFAEQTIRKETPAHLGVKICWVSKVQLEAFRQVWCAWLTELAKDEPDPIDQQIKLTELLVVFEKLKNIYPQAALFDCIDGNDENRVILGNTAIINDKTLDEQIAWKKLNN